MAICQRRTIYQALTGHAERAYITFASQTIPRRLLDLLWSCVDIVGEQEGQHPGPDVHHSDESTASRSVCTDDDVIRSSHWQPV